MRNTTHIMRYVAAAIIFVVLGALGGWYYVVQRHIATTTGEGSARGTGLAPSFGGALGSAFENAIGANNTASPTGERRAAPRFWQVIKNPVAGFGFASTTPRLYFAEVATGNILEADPLTSGIERRTNTLLPKPFEAQFSPSGAVIMRFLEGEQARTYTARLSTATSTDTASSSLRLAGDYLSPEILDIAITPKETLVYLQAEATGGASIVQSDWKGGAPKKILSLPLRGWDLSTMGDGTIVIAQKASDSVTGAAFTVSATGALTPLVENQPGLTVLAKTPTTVLFGSGLALSVKTANKGTIALTQRTLAEKCVWSRGTALILYCAVPRLSLGATPFLDRYQGVRHSSDTWYRIDVEAGTAEEIFAPDSSAEIDVEKPQIDAGNRYIAFTSAADKSLWMLRITP